MTAFRFRGGDWKWGRAFMRKDVIVLGAGIVGVSIAVHLQKRGRSVLLDRQAQARRGNLLRQCGPDPARRRLSLRFPARFRRAAALCPQQHHRRPLPLGRHPEARPLPVAVLDAFASRPAQGDRADVRAAHRAQRHRAYGAGRGIRLDEPDPPDRLDEGVPQTRRAATSSSPMRTRSSAISASTSSPSTPRRWRSASRI